MATSSRTRSKRSATLASSPVWPGTRLDARKHCAPGDCWFAVEAAAGARGCVGARAGSGVGVDAATLRWLIGLFTSRDRTSTLGLQLCAVRLPGGVLRARVRLDRL